MKHLSLLLLTTILLLANAAISRAQLTNLVFFSGNGERFSVVLNGILQNAAPETNIKITDLPGPSYKLKILFEDAKLPEINKTLMFTQGTETTFNIKKNNKGVYVVRFMNQYSLADQRPPVPEQQIVVFTTVPPVTTTVTQTKVTSTSVSASAGAQGSSGVSGSTGVSAAGSSASITTSETTITTTTTGQPEGNSGSHKEHHGDHYIMPGYNGAVGCPWPISDLDFADVKKTIASKSFEESKLSIAKEVTSSNCLFSEEVKEILMLFSFESTRLEFAKFAFRYTYDRGNYYKVNKAFQFESSTDELNEYLSGLKKP
jgi:hypothetical protein